MDEPTYVQRRYDALPWYWKLLFNMNPVKYRLQWRIEELESELAKSKKSFCPNCGAPCQNPSDHVCINCGTKWWDETTEVDA